MPPTYLHFQTSQKYPRVSHPWLLVFHPCNVVLVLPCLITFSFQISFQNQRVPLCSYSNSKGCQCETSRPLDVLYPFKNHHTQTIFRAPLWTWCVQTSSCTHQLLCLLDQRASSLGVRPLPCVFFCADFCDSSWLCQWGSLTSLVCQCTHVVEGRRVHSLGMLPSFLALAQMQPSLYQLF